MSHYDQYQLIWQGIHITIRHCKSWLSESAPLSVQHIELRSEDSVPLPITETGYKSHFMCGGEALADYDNSPVSFILAWLEHEAKASKWEPKRQIELFYPPLPCRVSVQASPAAVVSEKN